MHGTRQKFGRSPILLTANWSLWGNSTNPFPQLFPQLNALLPLLLLVTQPLPYPQSDKCKNSPLQAPRSRRSLRDPRSRSRLVCLGFGSFQVPQSRSQSQSTPLPFGSDHQRLLLLPRPPLSPFPLPPLSSEKVPQDYHETADDSEKDEEEEEEEVLPTGKLEKRALNHPPCVRCRKGRRPCESNPNGGSCLPCKGKKYKCEYANSEPGGKRGCITKEEYWDGNEGEGSEEELAPPPAKKRATRKKAEPDEGEGSEEELAPPPAKKRATRKKAEPVWVKKEPKGRNPPKPRVATRKGKEKVVNPEEEVQDAMEEEEDEDEETKPKPKPTRTYTRCGTFVLIFNFFIIDSILDIDKRFARLEAQVANLTEGAKEMQRMTARLTGLETDVHRFTGALENFLGRIRIDDGLRLVQDYRRIASVDPADITIEFDPDTADDEICDFDRMVSKPDCPGSDSITSEPSSGIGADGDQQRRRQGSFGLPLLRGWDSQHTLRQFGGHSDGVASE